MHILWAGSVTSMRQRMVISGTRVGAGAFPCCSLGRGSPSPTIESKSDSKMGHPAFGHNNTALKQRRANHRVFYLIGRECGGNNNICNPYRLCRSGPRQTLGLHHTGIQAAGHPGRQLSHLAPHGGKLACDGRRRPLRGGPDSRPQDAAHDATLRASVPGVHGRSRGQVGRDHGRDAGFVCS